MQAHNYRTSLHGICTRGGALMPTHLLYKIIYTLHEWLLSGLFPLNCCSSFLFFATGYGPKSSVKLTCTGGGRKGRGGNDGGREGGRRESRP